jgi:DNA (cytosine-5)-methyltransferase 1
MTPRGLDLCCGAGGATDGYIRAGFEMTGVDINPSRNYPGMVIEDDVLHLLDTTDVSLYDFVHASPPCQNYSVTRSLHDAEYPSLIEPIRERLETAGVPYVIENVVGAPLINPIRLCGSSFGLGVRRHRLFETSPTLTLVPPCVHHLQPFPIDVTGGGPSRAGRTRTGGGVSRKPKNVQEALDAMGIDRPMTRAEVNEAIPPSFTHWIGERLLASIGYRVGT